MICILTIEQSARSPVGASQLCKSVIFTLIGNNNPYTLHPTPPYTLHPAPTISLIANMRCSRYRSPFLPPPFDFAQGGLRGLLKKYQTNFV